MRKDQRLHVRYELIDFALIETPEGEAIRCVIVDVSLGGLQIRSKQNLPVGEKCFLRMAFGDKKLLRIRGEVRHSQPVAGAELFASGFRFLPESEQQRREVMQYVHEVFVRKSEVLVS